ncbi:hypothetical protein [Mycobacterium lentiflavum]|uniref:MarR family transcriptional regulator n=1 Tax=Mycobacterium lentiflavum TaxID=141349 RepID=A0ABY3UPW0_MYCLN|nr:hypothetical protein [Mycobacterium lentiflavum]ULP41612.1 hypothetical protein MJO58_22635 [Mycobacterium lentiflavum]
MAAALKPFALTLAEYVCLRMLVETPGMSSAELARDRCHAPDDERDLEEFA